MNRDLTTAQAAGLISCHSCHLLCERGERSRDRLCPRCGAGLHDRIPNSIARTWALVLAAIILYIPANVLPITVVIRRQRTDARIRKWEVGLRKAKNWR